MKRIKFQLYAGIGGFPRGAMISAVGGLVMVATAGGSAKATLYNADGTSLANPVTLTSGGAEIYVADSIDTVDLYIMAPGGQFVSKAGVAPGADPDIAVDTTNRNQVAVIPFSVTDQAGDATETSTGFIEPANAMFLPNASVRVTTIDATETVDVGTLAGDPNGFIAAAAVGVLGVIKGTLANGAATLGALLFVQDSITAGDAAPEAHVSTGLAITYTLTTGADTAEGFIVLPYILTA